MINLMPKIIFVVLTNGIKERIEISYPTWVQNLDLILFDKKIIFDSSGDDEYYEYLNRYDMEVIKLGKLDLPNAFNQMFKHLSQLDFDYVMFFEDDFSIPNYINILDLIKLSETENFDQLALIRQAYYPFEIEEISLSNFLIKKQNFVEKNKDEQYWLETELWWTNNPSLISKRVFDVEYPIQFENCEYEFSNKLKNQYTDFKSVYYGAVKDQHRVIHYPLIFGAG